MAIDQPGERRDEEVRRDRFGERSERGESEEESARETRNRGESTERKILETPLGVVQPAVHRNT